MIGTFIKRPVFTTMFVLLLVVFGIRCYPEIGVDWPLPDGMMKESLIISEKDQKWGGIKEYINC